MNGLAKPQVLQDSFCNPSVLQVTASEVKHAMEAVLRIDDSMLKIVNDSELLNTIKELRQQITA